jgi:hypothetical protein
MTRLWIAAAFAVASLLKPAVAQLPSSPPWPVQTFKSVPRIQPLALQVNKTGHTAPGYLFMAPTGFSHLNSTAPVIISDDNELIWNGPPGQAFNFGTYMYQGQSVLAYWNGTLFPEPIGRGYGSVVLLNSSYQVIATVTLPGNFQTLNASQTFRSNIDLHELNITPSGTMLVTANNVTQRDLSSAGGPTSGWTVDAMVYEIDIATNEILFEWHSLDHLDKLPYTLSKLLVGEEGTNGTTQATAWNYFHINAVSQYNGDYGYLVSSRYLCSIIALEKATGNVAWRLGGDDNGGDFAMASNASFCYQHDVRLRSSTQNGTQLEISIFDNANSPLTLPNPTTPSSGLALQLDTTTKTASALVRYQNADEPVFSIAQGSLQYIFGPQSHKLVGYGLDPFIQEFDASGTSVMTAQFGPMAAGQGVPLGGVLNYRAFRSFWIGCPRTPPAVYAESVAGGGGVNVYMSWNGNTEYWAWTVFAGNSSSANLQTMGTNIAKTGFETMFVINETVAFVQVQATIRSRRCEYVMAQTMSPIVAVV